MKIPQPIPAERRFTINDFNAKFKNDDDCLDWLMEQRYPGSRAIFSYCKVERKHHRIATKKAYAFTSEASAAFMASRGVMKARAAS